MNLLETLNLFNGFNMNFASMLSILSMMSGILMVMTKNPIVSVLYLIFLFSNMSVFLIFEGLVFLGLSYLLVYVGAVSILFLFMLMLMNMSVSELMSETTNNMPLAMMATLCFFIPFSNMMPNSDNEKNFFSIVLFENMEKQISHVSSNNWDSSMMESSDITTMGNIMYTSHFIWLMLTSIMLLLAMVGSMVMTMKQKN